MAQSKDYIQILKDTLDHKYQVLTKLVNLTKNQGMIIAESDFDMDAFNQLMNQKEIYLTQMNQLDEGFEIVYQRVGELLKGHKEEYREDIIYMQNTLKQLTDISMELQQLEQENQSNLSLLFSGKRKELHEYHKSRNIASAYYKAMSNTQVLDSVFLDKKH